MKKFSLVMAMVLVVGVVGFLAGCGGSGMDITVPEGGTISVTRNSVLVHVPAGTQLNVSTGGQQVAAKSRVAAKSESERKATQTEVRQPETWVAEEAGYYYASSTKMSSTRDFALTEARRMAVSSLFGKLPANVDRKDLPGDAVEKVDEAVSMSGSFYRATVKVRVSKALVDKVIAAKKGPQVELIELDKDIYTDQDRRYYYVDGFETSSNQQFALDGAAHDARIRLARYFNDRLNIIIEVSEIGGQVVSQGAKRNDSGRYEGTVRIKIPRAGLRTTQD